MSSSPAPHVPEPVLAVALRLEGSGSGTIINFDLIEGNMTAEPSWPQHSALPRAGRILRDPCKHVGLTSTASSLSLPGTLLVPVNASAVGRCGMTRCPLQLWESRASDGVMGMLGITAACTPLTETSTPSS